MHSRFGHRYVAVFAALVLICFYFFFSTYYYSANVKCYSSKDPSLPNILYAYPPKDKSIFFHQTSCDSVSDKKILITAREACAVESAARMNPNFDVYLLYLAPGFYRHEATESDLFLEALLSYENIKLHHINLDSYTSDTPVQDLYRQGKIHKSKYPELHARNILRYLTLWKYGGISLDLDLVVIKSLQNLPPNFVGAQSKKKIGTGVMGLSATGIGNNLATQCLRDLQYNFDGTVRDRSGAGVIEEVLKNVCAAVDVEDLIERDSCVGDFTVYPSKMFYPIRWENWKMFLRESTKEWAAEMIKNSYVVYSWSYLNSSATVSAKEDVMYNLLAKKYCPRVFSKCTFF